MADPTKRPGQEPFATEALLYLAGEMDSAEARAFEQCLQTERAAQTQLANAVQLTMLLNGESPTPQANYREHVRNRLQVGIGRGIGFRWFAFAAGLAVALLVAALPWWTSPTVPIHAAVVSTTAAADDARRAERREPPGHAAEAAVYSGMEEDELDDMAEHWAALTTNEHWQRTSTGDGRRKPRREHGHSVLQSIFGERLSSLK